MNYKQVSDKPCAYITKEKQRVKQFGQNVYLKDGSEFEIELYNGSRKTVLSKIKINGEFISQSGIVLRPGERVFLERYLDEPRKFKFQTYDVDLTNETKNAIVNNGDVEINFYDEQEVIGLTLTDGSNFKRFYYGSDFIAPIGATTFTTTNLSYSSNLGFDPAMNIPVSYFNNNIVNGDNYTSFETGRVEKGSNSDQEFKWDNRTFNSWTTSKLVWKILPESQKPVEKTDLIQKCPKCSTKVKKSSWKFCPECGNVLKRTKTEIIYVDDLFVSEINGKDYWMKKYNMSLDEFFEQHKNKLIYLKKDTIGSDTIMAIVID